MRVSIVAEDNKIYIDKVLHECDCRPLLADKIRAVQWYDDWGEVEFVGHSMPNMRIESLSGFQQLIDKATPVPKPLTAEEYELEATKAREADPATRLGHSNPSPRFITVEVQNALPRSGPSTHSDE